MGIFQSNEAKIKSQRLDYINHNTGNIFNYYNLIKHIGLGRCGAVFHATDIKTSLPRAIKEFRKSKMNNDQTNSFESEVKIIKLMDHPNIMKIYEVIESPYAYYLVCELLEGKNLMEVILNNIHYTKSDTSRFMEDILYAVSYLHQEGIMHNDIRPDNLVFEGSGISGKLKLIDFGLACEGNNKSGKYGQIHFRAPETFKTVNDNKDFLISAKSDIWSIGVIFYILLNKKPLVTGSKVKEIKNFLKKFQPDSLEELDIDKDELQLLKALLQKDENVRISAQEALSFDYFKANRKTNKEEIRDTIERMKGFKSTSVLNTKMMSMVAVHLLTGDEEKSRSQVFRALDNKFDGVIDRQELEDASYSFGFPYEYIDLIMKNSDLDKNNKVSYTEFLTSSLNWEEFLNEEKIGTVLSHFDIIRKGALTESELKKLLKGVSDEEWSNFFKIVDSNNDRLISISELQHYFLRIAESFNNQPSNN